MTIDPSSGPSGPAPTSDPTDPTSPAPPASPTGPVDTLTSSLSSGVGRPANPGTHVSSKPSLTLPVLSLLQYANLVGTARINLTTQNQYSDQLGFVVTKGVWNNAAASAEAMRNALQTLSTIQQNQIDLAGQQQASSDALTPVIDAYNTQNDFAGDQAATDAMNQAINDYNNGLITDVDFNAAATTYNTYADAHNLQPYVTDYNTQADIYNAQVDSFNAQVDEANASITEANNFTTTGTVALLPYEVPLPSGTLPTQDLVPPATSPIPLLPNPANPIPAVVQTIFPSSGKDLLQDSGVGSYIDNLENSLNVVNKQVAAAESFRDYNIFTHRDDLNVKNPPYNSDAYIQNGSQGSTPGSAGDGAAAGSGYAQLAMGLSSNALPRVLGLSLYKAAMRGAEVPVYLSDFIALTNMTIGQKAGMLSAAPGVLAIGDSSLDGVPAGGPPVKVLVALGYANVIRGLITSQQLSGLIGNLLATNGVSEGDLAKLTKSVTAGFQLSLIQQAIFQVANALGLPGSISQILGNLTGIPNLDSVIASVATPGINDVLHNSSSANALKANLSAQAGGNSQAINDAVDAAIARGDYSSAAAFNAALKEELINRGVSEDAARASAAQSSALIDSELNNQALNESVTEGQIADSLQSDQITQQAVAQGILNDAQLTSARTAREVRDNVLKQYTLQGITFQDALQRADQLASVLTGNRLAQEYSAQVLNESVLQKSIQQNLAQVGGDASLAASVTSSVLAREYSNITQIRDAIYSQLVLAGLNAAHAHTVADNAALVRKNADPFYSIGGASVLSPGEISARIRAEAYSILRQSFDNPTAMSVAQQLASAVVGAPSNQDVLYNDLNKPLSLMNLANDQVAALKETADEKAIAAVTDSFRETMRPTDNLFYIAYLQNTPGQELINAMSLMNEGHGKRASNYQNTIDIAV